jgi:hypothetical protein
VKRRVSWRQAKAQIGAVAPKEKKNQETTLKHTLIFYTQGPIGFSLNVYEYSKTKIVKT